jgi:predicted O-methyltransferase YrrM
MTMDATLAGLLDEIARSGREHDEHGASHDSRMLNLEPDTARLVSLFARSSRRQRVLEIGTSNGYSTLWLAWSIRPHNGRVISIDRDAGKQELAEANLRHAGLREVVELVLGDATEVVRGLDGPFDCIFFDADRVSAPEQLELLLPKLRDDVLLMADNALSHPDEIAGYLAALQALPDFERLVIPVGKGLSVAYRGRGAVLECA